MPQLDNILAFVKVAEFESVSKAARSLGVPVSTVSRRLSVLESEVGVALVRRTTRRITLTPQGTEYYKRSLDPLIALQEAERALRQTRKRLEGTLKISVPMILAQPAFTDFLSSFSAAAARSGCASRGRSRVATANRPARLSCGGMGSDSSRAGRLWMRD